MKVLKAGTPQKGWSMKATCTGAGNKGGGCGAKLLVEQADVFMTYSSALSENYSYHTFECPSCGVLTDIPNSVSLPFEPKDRPKKRSQDNGEK